MSVEENTGVKSIVTARNRKNYEFGPIQIQWVDDPTWANP